MEIFSLASGSKGNSILINNILIDCGISFRQIKTRLASIGKSVNDIKYLLITHEHNDHIAGIGTLLGNIDLEVFMTEKTYNSFGKSFDKIRGKKISFINYYESFYLDNVLVTPIPLSHDSADCIGFTFKGDEFISYFADTGYFKSENYNYVKNANKYIIEFNHDIEMLNNSKRPIYLIQRILSNKGHLCNYDACDVLNQVIGDNTLGIYPCHISEECNCDEKIFEMISEALNNYKKFDIKLLRQDEVVKI